MVTFDHFSKEEILVTPGSDLKNRLSSVIFAFIEFLKNTSDGNIFPFFSKKFLAHQDSDSKRCLSSVIFAFIEFLKGNTTVRTVRFWKIRA